jgi:tRNA(His) guanylyltransferase
MKFDDLDHHMRRYETARDAQVPEDAFIVARMDGRGFTRLTKEVLRFEAPYDERFRDAIVATARHLMDCGFRALHAYCQSDEISLLLHPEDRTFQRKERKLLSVLAGEASAAITHALSHPACMDARLCPLPDAARVADYFRWRMEDARRNCLNSHAYWLLRRLGQDATTATAQLSGLSVEEKTALLAEHGILFAELPAWQRFGFAVEWQQQEKMGRDPRTGEETRALRRRLNTLLDLPEGPDYGQHIEALLPCYEHDDTESNPQSESTPQLQTLPAAKVLTIISGGQTGVDRGALDAALALRIPCGGWVPQDRKAEDGMVPDHYPVQPLPAGGYHARTVANLKLADGTVVIYWRNLEGGTAETVRLAIRHGRPLTLVDAAEVTPELAGQRIRDFVSNYSLQSLNVAGPRASKWKKAANYTQRTIRCLLTGNPTD